MATKTYEVGKFYMVPTVQAKFAYRYDIWPIIGPRHEDAEHIKFDQHHYHFDFRFMSKAQFAYAQQQSGCKWRGEGAIFAFVLMAEPGGLNPDPLATVYRRRQCRRAMPEFPSHVAPWLPRLSAAYADKTLVDGHICPHRGASLQGLPVDAEGCVVCPLHGLRWHIATGRQRLPR